MTPDPYSDDDFTKASEHLRLAITLLSRHKIAPSPLNFRMAYEYVAGKNEDLKSEFAEIIGQSNEPSSEDLREIHEKFFVQDDKTLEKLRQELRHIIVNIQDEFKRSGGNLADYMETLGNFAGVLDTSVQPEMIANEVRMVIDSTHTMEQSQHQLESQMSSTLAEVEGLRNELEQIREESLTDALTGISNRKAFDAALKRTVVSANQEKLPFCLLLADIDHFKRFNDTYGHLVGDKVLRFTATTLKECLKGRDIVARFGGEEFALILGQIEMADAKAVAEQIRKAVSLGKLKGKGDDKDYGGVTISLGVAQFRWNENPIDLIERADRALYLAKDAGRDRVRQVA